MGAKKKFFLYENSRGGHFVRLICRFVSGIKLTLASSGSQCQKIWAFPSLYIPKPALIYEPKVTALTLDPLGRGQGVNWVSALLCKPSLHGHR